MKNQYDILVEQFGKLLDLQDFHEEDLDYGLLEHHIGLLKRLDAISSGAISVFDMYRREHAYFSPKFETIFGWDAGKINDKDSSYGDERMHPDDRIQLMQAGIYFTSFALGIPVENKKDYKMIADYRVLGRKDEYVRAVEQQSILELDKRGNIWLALSMLDLSPYSDTDTPFRSRMINFKTGELFVFPPEGQPRPDLLTMREIEILHLISRGLVSREIADVLYISVNTVNTHRQRIIEKLDVSNTSEAIRYAMDLGILSR